MTFSLVVSVPGAGLLGAATASRSLGVGNAVPAVWPGVGAVVSQAWTNRSLRGHVLSRLCDGATPAQALAEVPDVDPGHARRQLAVVDAAGATAACTGEKCSAWAGSVVLAAGDVAGVACANLVVGERVLTDLADAVCPSAPMDPAGLAELLVGALRAGQAAGGDRRGQQSAAIVVGAGGPQAWWPPDLDVDLRVDDSPHPVEEVARLLRDLRARPA